MSFRGRGGSRGGGGRGGRGGRGGGFRGGRGGGQHFDAGPPESVIGKRLLIRFSSIQISF